MEKIINNLMARVSDDEVREMAEWICIDYSNTAEGRKKIIEKFVNEIFNIQEYQGECANDYSSRLDYVERGGFEKDYFDSWLESCSDYPYLNEIKEFCESVDRSIKMWLYAVECGYIEPNDGWAYGPFELEKARAEAEAIYEARKNIG